MNENPTINYAFALKNYSQNGKGRSMKKFCEDEGYDYDKFLQYSRRGQKEFSVLKEADEQQRDAGKFVQLVVDGVSVALVRKSTSRSDLKNQGRSQMVISNDFFVTISKNISS